MLALFLNALLEILSFEKLADWVAQSGLAQTLIFTTLFFLLTLFIISAGIRDGIEKWSTKLMPALILMMVLLIAYVLTQEGSFEGLKSYLLPDFRKVFTPRLLLDAMGQSFFSLSLAVGGMLVFAGYTSKKANLLSMGLWVTLADLGIAFLAGLLIIPAMYVAQAHGTQIFDDHGELLSGQNLIFQVLPELFNSLGSWGIVLAMVFFLLMSLAAITSSISMMEVPTSYLIDNWGSSRHHAVILVASVFWIISMIIVFNQEYLFGAIVTVTTKYSQPLLGLAICIFVGWVMNRNTLLKELSQGNSKIAGSVFLKVWPFFIKYICPILILLVFLQSFLY